MKNKGFTLIELLVVATIISLLAGIGLVNYSQFMKKSRDERRKADLNTIRSALEMYKSDNDTYPTSLEDLTNSTPKYLQTVPKDPKYEFTYPYSPNCAGTVCTDYTLYGYLETGGNCTTTQACGSQTCNYCLGPYGEKESD